MSEKKTGITLNNTSALCIRKYGLLFFLYLFTAAAGLWANPFTGSKNTPAPIRTEQPPEFIVNRQAELHTKLGDYIYEWTQTNSVRTLWAIIALAFFYGFIHALGPGHRKTLVFSYYLTKKAPAWEPAVTGLILAGLHGVTSIVLLLIFRNVRGALSAHTNSAAVYLEGFSFLLLPLLSVASILHLLSHAFPKRFPHLRFGCSRTAEQPPQRKAIRFSRSSGAGGRYRHDYRYRPNAEKMQWATFLLSGIYPCPAAILVLVLVASLDAAGIGLAALISMSAGMAIPITASAYLAWTGRQRLFKRMQKTQKYAETAAATLSLAAYTAIFILSLIAALPFIKSLLAQ